MTLKVVLALALAAQAVYAQSDAIDDLAKLLNLRADYVVALRGALTENEAHTIKDFLLKPQANVVRSMMYSLFDASNDDYAPSLRLLPRSDGRAQAVRGPLSSYLLGSASSEELERKVREALGDMMNSELTQDHMISAERIVNALRYQVMDGNWAVAQIRARDTPAVAKSRSVAAQERASGSQYGFAMMRALATVYHKRELDEAGSALRSSLLEPLVKAVGKIVAPAPSKDAKQEL